jgi:hypothetical protein
VTQARRRSANDDVNACMLANFRHMFAFEVWSAARKDNFDWRPVEATPKLQFTLDALAAGVLLRDGDIWMLGCWDRGGWARLTEGASWQIGNWHPALGRA